VTALYDSEQYYMLGPSKWYVTSYAQDGKVVNSGPEGKFRDGVLEVIARFREHSDLHGVEYAEFSDDYTDAVIRWYPQQRKLTWDYENWGNGWAREGFRVSGELSEDAG
jgi:hypothetical protein